MSYGFDEIIDRRHTSCLKYDFAAERGREKDVLPLWVADMDFSAPPAVIEALKARAEHGIFGYSRPKPDYFRAVSGWFEERHNWSPRQDAFVVACGVVFAISALLRTVTKEGDAVLICQPVYYPFESTVRDNGRELVVSELVNFGGHYEVDFEDFEKKIVEHNVKAFILCSPHNPVGRVWTKDELAHMGDICLKHGVFVISDEIHADFTFEGHTHCVFPTVRKEYEATCAVCTAPTKTFNLAGLHVSNIYIPNDQIRAAYQAELEKIGYSEPNVMGLTACVAAYTHGGDWLNELKEYLAENLAFLRTFLKENLPKVKLVEPEGTYLVWLDCRALNVTDSELQELVEQKAKVWLDDGYIFGKGGSGFERINIACPRATLKEALKRLQSALR